MNFLEEPHPSRRLPEANQIVSRNAGVVQRGDTTIWTVSGTLQTISLSREYQSVLDAQAVSGIPR
jgi:hypothetical protein